MIYKCLEKSPEKRFANGSELHEYIILNSSLAAKKEEIASGSTSALQNENQKLLLEKDALQKLALQRQNEVTQLREAVADKNNELESLRQKVYTTQQASVRQGVSPTAFYVLLLITALLTAFAAYSLLSEKAVKNEDRSFDSLSTLPADTESYSAQVPESQDTQTVSKATKMLQTTDTTQNLESKAQSDPMNFDTARSNTQTTATDSSDAKKSLGKYRVRSKAYFYNEPDETTQRDAFIVHWNNAVLDALDEKDGFIYVVFTNAEGQTSRGWLKKSDLEPVSE
jgi:serine/threonine-protein kinase